MQDRVPNNEKLLWEQQGDLTDAYSLWRSHEALLVAPVALVTILINNVQGLDLWQEGKC